MFADTLDARRCSRMLWMFGAARDVWRCSDCSAMLWMLADALDPPGSTMVQKILRECRVSASTDSVSAAVFAQSSPSPGGEARTTETDRARGTAPFRKLQPRQAALWPKRFCMDFARTFGRSKSQPWAS